MNTLRSNQQTAPVALEHVSSCSTDQVSDLVVDGVHNWDYPDFADAFIAAAIINGKPATDAQLEVLNQNGELVNSLAHEAFHGN